MKAKTWAMAVVLPALAGCVTAGGGGATVEEAVGPAPYLVVDLSAGPKAAHYAVRASETGPDLANAACRTSELWLRRIEAGEQVLGTFSRDSDASVFGGGKAEFGRSPGERLYKVRFPKAFYAGVFEVTQKQWELVTGTNPSRHKGDARPVETVAYEDVRGERAGASFAPDAEPDADSFLGKLSARTGIAFDLPTEAQWEYACRAGTRTALSNGKDIRRLSNDVALEGIARYGYNRFSGSKEGFSEHDVVGERAPNAWGLYDCHGNVAELCADYGGAIAPEAEQVDPRGPRSGRGRRVRGGSWRDGAVNCRSGARDVIVRPHETFSFVGFRVSAR